MESYEDDFLKEVETRFSFDEYGVHFCEASLVNENITEIEKFVDDLVFA